MQFWGKIGKNNRLAPPPLQLAHHPLGNPGSATEMDFIVMNETFPNVLKQVLVSVLENQGGLS